MDKKRTDGVKHEVKDAIKEGAEKVTGSTGKQVAGNAETNAGKLERVVGKASDNAKTRSGR